MGFLLFFNVRKPRKFNHTPVFFDPRKEALEERVQKAKKNLGMDIPDEEFKPTVKGALADQTQHLRRRMAAPEKSSASTNIKLAVALVVIVIAAYYLFFN